MLNFLILFAMIIAFTVVVAHIEITNPRSYIKFSPLEKNWNQVVLICSLFTIMSAMTVWELFSVYVESYQIIATIGAAALGMILSYSIFTDLILRRVDSRITVAITFIVAVAGFYSTFVYGDQLDQTIFIVFTIFATVFVFVTGKSWGPGDGLGILVATLIGLPILGYQLWFYNIIAVSVLSVGYGLISTIRQKTMKVSLAGVPVIVGPFYISILLIGLGIL